MPALPDGAEGCSTAPMRGELFGGSNDLLCPDVVPVPRGLEEHADEFKYVPVEREVFREFPEDLCAGEFRSEAVGPLSLEHIMLTEAGSGDDKPTEDELLALLPEEGGRRSISGSG